MLRCGWRGVKVVVWRVGIWKVLELVLVVEVKVWREEDSETRRSCKWM